MGRFDRHGQVRRLDRQVEVGLRFRFAIEVFAHVAVGLLALGLRVALLGLATTLVTPTTATATAATTTTLAILVLTLLAVLLTRLALRPLLRLLRGALRGERGIGRHRHVLRLDVLLLRRTRIRPAILTRLVLLLRPLAAALLMTLTAIVPAPVCF
jgi:hypothetical protein